MDEKNIIKKISALRAIKLDENWKNNDKSRLLLLLEENYGQSEQSWLARVFDVRILFQPISRGVLAGFLAIFVFGAFLFNFLISRENIHDYSDIISVDYNGENNKEIGKVEAENGENNKETRNNDKISLFPQSISSNDMIIGGIVEKEKNKEKERIDSHASLLNNREDYFTDFRINLNERINRVWVLAYESGNNEILMIADEAEKLFNKNDYDAALRAIMVAENLLD